jgi:hypothetical protein
MEDAASEALHQFPDFGLQRALQRSTRSSHVTWDGRRWAPMSREA